MRDGSLERVDAESEAMEEDEPMQALTNATRAASTILTADTEHRSQDTCALRFSYFS